MKLKHLLETKKLKLIYNIPHLTGDYYQRENVETRTKDKKTETYKNFTRLLRKLKVSVDNEFWTEDKIIDFLYAENDFIYYNDSKETYTLIYGKTRDDKKFKKFEQISFNDYLGLSKDKK